MGVDTKSIGYSDAEWKLVKFFGMENVAWTIDSPITVYRMMGEKAFLADMKGPEVEALRRCIHAINNCTIYRNTHEWDALINLTD